ncbi:Chromodomain Y-like protein 2 [Aphelenchoides avenae]|nr:Chromodomain Y-like protein 2 [Aphelenchus avenae]
MASHSEEVGTDNETFEVECVLASRMMNRKRQYLVKWVGYPSNKSTWESASSLGGCKEAVEKFNQAKQEHNQRQSQMKKRLRQQVVSTSAKSRPSNSTRANSGSRASTIASTSSSNGTPTPTATLNSSKAVVLTMMKGCNERTAFRVKINGTEFIMQRDELVEKHPHALISFYESRLVFK